MLEIETNMKHSFKVLYFVSLWVFNASEWQVGSIAHPTTFWWSSSCSALAQGAHVYLKRVIWAQTGSQPFLHFVLPMPLSAYIFIYKFKWWGRMAFGTYVYCSCIHTWIIFEERGVGIKCVLHCVSMSLCVISRHPMKRYPKWSPWILLRNKTEFICSIRLDARNNIMHYYWHSEWKEKDEKTQTELK